MKFESYIRINTWRTKSKPWNVIVDHHGDMSLFLEYFGKLLSLVNRKINSKYDIVDVKPIPSGHYRGAPPRYWNIHVKLVVKPCRLFSRSPVITDKMLFLEIDSEGGLAWWAKIRVLAIVDSFDNLLAYSIEYHGDYDIVIDVLLWYLARISEEIARNEEKQYLEQIQSLYV